MLYFIGGFIIGFWACLYWLIFSTLIDKEEEDAIYKRRVSKSLMDRQRSR